MCNVLVLFACFVLFTDTDLFTQEPENIEQVGRFYNIGVKPIQENPKVIGYWDDSPGSAIGVAIFTQEQQIINIYNIKRINCASA